MKKGQIRNELDPRSLQAEIEDAYPDLLVSRPGELIEVTGSFPITYQGAELGRFQIRIELTDDFPDALPNLSEVGRRIPWVADRHMFSDGGCCVLVPLEWDLLPSELHSLRGYLDVPVRNFFLSQLAFEEGQGWPFGQRRHGLEGVLEAYRDTLGVADIRLVLPFIELLQKKNIKGHWSCPCRSGRIIRRCHESVIRALQNKIAPKVAKRALTFLKRSVPEKDRSLSVTMVIDTIARAREREQESN